MREDGHRFPSRRHRKIKQKQPLGLADHDIGTAPQRGHREVVAGKTEQRPAAQIGRKDRADLVTTSEQDRVPAGPPIEVVRRGRDSHDPPGLGTAVPGEQKRIPLPLLGGPVLQPEYGEIVREKEKVADRPWNGDGGWIATSTVDPILL